MKPELAPQRIPERRQNERQRNRREDDVRDQYEEINRPYPALAGKLGIAMKVVIRDVAKQEECRKHRRTQHESHMHDALTAPNIDVAADQAQSAQ